MSPRQKIALRLVLLVLVGSCLGFGPSANSVTQKLRAAQSAFADGGYREQAVLLASIAKTYPWWRSLWEEAGDAAFRGEDFQLALSCYQEAERRQSLSEAGRIKLGEAYQIAGQPDSAELVWQSLDLTPAALEKLALFYEEQGDLPAAVGAWEDYLALEEGPGSGDRVFHYAMLLAAVSPAQALVYLDQAAAEFPPAGKISAAVKETLSEEPAYQYVVSGQALASSDRWDLAAYAFSRAATLRPDYQEAYLYWGEALQHLEDPSRDPLDILEKGLELDRDAPLANLFLGYYWQRKGSHQQALEYFREAELGWPDHPEIYLEQGRSLAALGELEAALARYQKAIELDPLQAGSYRQLAEFCAAYSFQVQETGLPAARLAVQFNNQDPANLDAMGAVLLELGDQINADRFFQLALGIDPFYAPAYFHLGILYTARDDPERAVYYLQQTLLHTDNLATRDQAERLLSAYLP